MSLPAFTRVARAAIPALILGACTSGRPTTSSSPTPAGGRELTPAEQVHHVLDRLGFGARPGDAERGRSMGVDRWIELQLAPDSIDDSAIERTLALLETQRKRPFELIADHP